MHRFATTFLFAIMSTSLVHAQDDGWTGRWVLPRAPDTPLRNSDGTVTSKWSATAGKVVGTSEKWIKIVHGQGADSHQGRVLKAEVVTLSEAPHFFTEKIRMSDKDTWALWCRAEAWSLQGEHDKAIEDLTAVIRLDPSSQSYNNRAMLWGRKQEFDRALKDCDEAIRLDPKNEFALLHRGYVFHRKQEYNKAIADFTEAIRLNPKFAYAFSNRGESWRAKMAYDKALADHTESIRLDPVEASAYRNRGYVWRDKKAYAKAIADFTEAIRLDPTDDVAFVYRGRCQFAMLEYDKAIADYTEAIRLNPKQARVFSLRGKVWHSKREYEKAITDLAEAVRLDPKDVLGLNNLAVLLATCPDTKYRDGKRSVELATKACELTDWKSGSHLATLAAAHAETGSFEKAVEYQRKALADREYEKQSGETARAWLKYYEQQKR